MAPDTDGLNYMLDFFRDVPDGYLVDVGAHDGVLAGSMSRDLIVKGWGGLMVEPLPEAFRQLKEAYQDHPKVTLFEGACSDEDGVADLLPCKGVSTLSRDWAKACELYWKHVRYGAPVRVQKRRLSALLEAVKAPAHIHLLQIDTEGHDLYVLRGMDWTRTVDMVCVETLDMLQTERKICGIWQPHPDIHAFLTRHGFRQTLLTRGGNGFYVRGGL